MRIIITGSCGFIGSHLTEQLLKEDNIILEFMSCSFSNILSCNSGNVVIQMKLKSSRVCPSGNAFSSVLRKLRAEITTGFSLDPLAIIIFETFCDHSP